MGAAARHQGWGSAIGRDAAGGEEDRRDPDLARGSRGEPGCGGVIAAVSRTRCGVLAQLRSYPLPLWERGSGSLSAEADPSSVADCVRATFSHKGRREETLGRALRLAQF